MWEVATYKTIDLKGHQYIQSQWHWLWGHELDRFTIQPCPTMDSVNILSDLLILSINLVG